MSMEIEPRKNLSDFLTPKNIVIGVVSVVVLATLAIVSRSEVNGKIFILVGLCGIVAYTIYSISNIYSAYTSARDYIPSKDRVMIEKLIAEKNKEGLEVFIRFINMYGATGYITRMGQTQCPSI
jgi:hypothetical protein